MIYARCQHVRIFSINAFSIHVLVKNDFSWLATLLLESDLKKEDRKVWSCSISGLFLLGICPFLAELGSKSWVFCWLIEIANLPTLAEYFWCDEFENDVEFESDKFKINLPLWNSSHQKYAVYVFCSNQIVLSWNHIYLGTYLFKCQNWNNSVTYLTDWLR